MRLFSIVLISVLVGSLIGGALAYVNVGPPVLAGGGTSATAPTAADLETAPVVSIDELTYHFGAMQKGTSRSHEFTITNRGKSPLMLKAGATSCKCTMFDLSEAKLKEGDAAAQEPIAPGESVKVKLKWDALVPAGPFRQTAQLLTNDPRSPRLELSVEGEVTEVTGLYPDIFSLDKLRPGETKSASVQLVAYNDEPIVIKDSFVEPTDRGEQFKIDVKPLTEDELAERKAKSGVRIEVTNTNNLPLGLFDQSVVLRTNLPDKEELKIPIIGRVVGDITVHGRGWNEELGILHLGIIESEQGAETKLLVSTKGEHAKDIEFGVASTDPPELVAELGESKMLNPDRRHTELKISIPKGTRPMIHLGTAQGDEGKIVLKTNHPQSPEVVLNVRFAVER